MSEEVAVLATKFTDHCISNKKDVACFNKKINRVNRKVKNIDKIETNLSWVMKIQWAVITTLIGNLVGVLIIIFVK